MYGTCVSGIRVHDGSLCARVTFLAIFFAVFNACRFLLFSRCTCTIWHLQRIQTIFAFFPAPFTFRLLGDGVGEEDRFRLFPISSFCWVALKAARFPFFSKKPFAVQCMQPPMTSAFCLELRPHPPLSLWRVLPIELHPPFGFWLFE